MSWLCPQSLAAGGELEHSKFAHLILEQRDVMLPRAVTAIACDMRVGERRDGPIADFDFGGPAMKKRRAALPPSLFSCLWEDQLMSGKPEHPNRVARRRACPGRPSTHIAPRWLLLALIIAALVAVGDRSARAQLAIYDFNAGDFSPNTAANISASNFGIGPGITAESAGNFSFSSNGVPTNGILLRSDGMTGTEAGAEAGEDYLSFSVAPDPDFSLSLDSLTFDLVGSDNSAPTSNYVGEVAVRSSLDGFASTLATFAAANAGNGNPLPAEWDNETLDLTGVQFQGVTTPIEFRLFLFANANATGDVTRFDNVMLNGTSAMVPEPASLALWSLLGLGFGALLLMRHRHKGTAARR